MAAGSYTDAPDTGALHAETLHPETLHPETLHPETLHAETLHAETAYTIPAPATPPEEFLGGGWHTGKPETSQSTPGWPETRDEAGRLAALARYEILDTPPEPSFDTIVVAAKDLAGVPTALISLVAEERQWFKARCGYPLQESGRDHSLCAHVVAQESELILTDARTDPRFADHPAVSEDGVVFYAGFPLRTPEGHTLGTLCLVDTVPNSLREETTQMMRVLAEQVTHQLELRRALREHEEALHAHAAISGSLIESERRFRAAFEHGPLPMARIEHGRISAANPALERLLGRRVNSLQGVALLELIHPHDHENARTLTSLCRAAEATSAEARVRGHGGQWLSCELVASAVPDSPDQEHMLIQIADITVRKEREADLERAAHRDGLTGLWNRDGLRARLHALLQENVTRADERSAQTHTPGCGLVFIDLDGFKDVNDTFGHDTGDAVLQHIAYRLEELTPPGGGVARLGGDEFVIYTPLSTHPEDDSAVLLEAITTRVHQPILIEETTHHVGASAGVAILHAGEDINAALRTADARMYETKRWRRRAGERRQDERRTLEPRRDESRSTAARPPTGRISEMLTEGRITCNYQPVMDLEHRTCTGVEALIRAHTREGAPVSPEQIIAEAEHTGEIVALGRWVLEEAISEISAIRGSIPGAAALTLGVNLSPLQLDDDRLLTHISATLQHHSLPAGALVLEITEGELVETSHARRILHQLRELGVGLAVDDFGTGHASINYLRTLPLSVIKLDRSLTNTLDQAGRAGRVSRGAYRLANALETAVVAEGIETIAQERAVQAEGCHLVQGYLYSRALPGEALRAWLREQNPEHP